MRRSWSRRFSSSRRRISSMIQGSSIVTAQFLPLPGQEVDGGGLVGVTYVPRRPSAQKLQLSIPAGGSNAVETVAANSEPPDVRDLCTIITHENSKAPLLHAAIVGAERRLRCERSATLPGARRAHGWLPTTEGPSTVPSYVDEQPHDNFCVALARTVTTTRPSICPDDRAGTVVWCGPTVAVAYWRSFKRQRPSSRTNVTCIPAP